VKRVTSAKNTTRCDALVVGAGFGGLGAGLAFAERGLATVVLEALVYPGGCASTFTRGGHHFESGATLFGGFDEGQWFARLVREHALPVQLARLDPVIELVTPTWRLAVPRERAKLVHALEQLAAQRASIEAPPPPGAIARFFESQARVADALWPLLDDPRRLPPFDMAGFMWHASRAAKYLSVASVVGHSLADVARRHGVWSCEPVRVLLDAISQITIQCSASEAEAPFALATLDYPFRGSAHVVGGIGELAHGMAEAIERAAPAPQVGECASGVRYAHRAIAVERVRGTHDPLWRVHTTRGVFEAPRLALNVLPQAARRLLEVGDALANDEQSRAVIAANDAPAPTTRRTPLDPTVRVAHARLQRSAAAVESGWGACMLYLVADEPPGASPEPQHLELVRAPAAPFTEGNHVFVSIGGARELARGELRAPHGRRTITVSTHVPLAELLTLDDGGEPQAGESRRDFAARAAASPRAQRVAAVQIAMRATIAALAPEWSSRIVHDMSASPRTFERFTLRPHGFVGGVPRRRGLAQYLSFGARPLAPGLALVGDSVFPGQSTLAAALGGAKAAARLR
jgi:phytoene dehydrogenase-like protein